MKRDFAAESPVNLLLRAWRAARSRLRGRCYAWAGLFAPGCSRRLVFGAGARFINSRAMHFEDEVHFGVLARLECFGPFDAADPVRLRVGRGTSFGDYFHAGAVNRVTIGRDVLVGSSVLVIDHNHGEPRADLGESALSDPKQRALVSRGEVVIGDNVWLGDGVVVLPGSRIGEGAIIAAHAIVRGEVPPRTIHYG